MFEALEELMRELEASPDNRERQKLYQALVPIAELHRDALARMIEMIRQSGHEDLIDRFLEDELLASLLRGYELVEADLEEQVERALEKSRTFLKSHGGNVELLEMRGKVARLKLTGSCHGCSSSLITLKKGIEKILYDDVPQLRGVEVEGLTGDKAPGMKWLPLLHAHELHEGEWLKVQLFEDELLVCTVDGRPFVFRNRCPAGTATLESAEFQHLVLVCACHRFHFDLRSGACADDSALHLHTYPAALENAVVMVGT